ncbi:VWA domain-containing protein, partial [Candidatus Saccharibacteria bacterium]|nr:VWA domain-containing protein [Candidatus Saccharibacteria bacterium]
MNKLKRVFCAIFAFTLVGANINGIIPTAAAGDAPIIENPDPVEITKDGVSTGIVLSKTAEPVEGYVNRYKVTLRVESPKTEKTSDTVLVIDRSNSMNGSRISAAKAAADS